jgi:hypothetical protein
LLEEIKEYYTEKQIMEAYLGRFPLNSVSHNPFRVDNNPSCTLSWYKGELLFRDWTIGYTWDIVGVAGLKFDILSPLEDPFVTIKGKYYLIVNKMYDELVKGKEIAKLDTTFINTPTIKGDKKIEVVKRDWAKYDLDYWELPISVLEGYHIYPISYGLVGDTVVMRSSVECPTYAYYFPEYSTKEHQVWKLYSPKSRNFNKQKWLGNVKADYIFKTF